MADHPGWRLDDQGCLRRLMCSSDAVWLVTATPLRDGAHQIDLELVDGPPDTDPRVDVVDPAALADSGTGLHDILLEAGPVARVRSSDLWDALVGATLRCTMPPERARAVYRDNAAGFGTSYDTPLGRASLFPSPQVILELSADVIEVSGLGHVRGHLRTAAWVARELESRWRTVPCEKFATILGHVPRLGSLIAGAAVADLSSDFRCLEPGDVLVRRRVRALDPAASWPDDPRAFGTRWQQMTGTERSAWTVLVLAADARHIVQVP
ncbi:hypothetical protein NQK81_02025 [Amycolatopsis roodepoortensis]|uniref:hypothetical protein n=1 Tax=Amycolatopsis roodepoortensis TaxID=700274 RepID=UPI00214AA405|nr:hypothetical protein [Amycolatopsis roodepoortensis]UUV32252.1 hypothetical protein NQK81_02025 [Amycolatopsis roodepoortensis]